LVISLKEMIAQARAMSEDAESEFDGKEYGNYVGEGDLGEMNLDENLAKELGQ